MAPVCLYYDSTAELMKTVHADRLAAHDQPGLRRVEVLADEYAKLRDVRLISGRAFAYDAAKAALGSLDGTRATALQSRIAEADAVRALEEQRERERQEAIARERG